ncbi:DnaJ domain-containing protein [Phaeosphaeriaceae sp. PMI808]|nr:DnaJ domain-containing protein [Phaeosphaeriaceae sp. PMI808]
MAGPDYYQVLEINSKATQQQVRDAYKKAALKHHPDRVPADSPERTARTKRFQQINDAYYTLSDATRRRDYDAARTYNSWTGTTATPEPEDFGDEFGGIFEEMLREEGMANQDATPTGKFWSIVGGLSGGAMGFIVANFPGMLAGAVAGNRLGSVRDAKGKSVYEVFRELPQADKARMLSDLAAKVFANVMNK